MVRLADMCVLDFVDFQKVHDVDVSKSILSIRFWDTSCRFETELLALQDISSAFRVQSFWIGTLGVLKLLRMHAKIHPK